jgi:hypothetical protein
MSFKIDGQIVQATPLLALQVFFFQFSTFSWQRRYSFSLSSCVSLWASHLSSSWHTTFTWLEWARQPTNESRSTTRSTTSKDNWKMCKSFNRGNNKNPNKSNTEAKPSPLKNWASTKANASVDWLYWKSQDLTRGLYVIWWKFIDYELFKLLFSKWNRLEFELFKNKIVIKCEILFIKFLNPNFSFVD